ncbi:type IV-A pilus assembly ATPase PilB [Methylotenera sp.]|uniref:type IV-A pilus assembly ATPase PilB n=1 Tax=Methylotenera sp. TaxID=2051956 RepID=UPI002727A48D|nr:type IV-A pilus assembly ATPase PilB [Methylotenera sp.]MDO9206295.1 type IV-A pilus assembly ATPase PilB [Methylotenera sp.]MDP2071208.1 type IV-A pilus assembly ATPase PilB [Methylotenera sp.]MDP3004607.1 type IV-A pilus assembly ATPase PilB [Methylotenera sp.]MDP3307514.1 type IV-A pilus assembly ATPase PilB [Methylotenera sp.]MDP3819649.1 type IV-A pilus assembly ATPase PilB [Methylotenera sp.]
MANATPSIKLSGLARTLIQEKLLSEDEANAIQAQANTVKSPFITQLILSKKLNAQVIAETSAKAFGFPYFNLDAFNPDYLPSKKIDEKLMQSNRVLALQVRNNILYVAISDPTNLHALDSVQFQMGMALSPVVVEDDKLSRWIDKIVEASDTNMRSLNLDDDYDLGGEEGQPQEEVQTQEVDDAPVVKFLNKMLLDAINMGASDLHFEPYEKFYRVRYRVDGILREITQPPLAIKEKLASRIKVISSMDISEKRIPQDGRMKLVLSKTRTIDFRVSTLPLINGEKIVMRILDPSSATLGIEALGYEPVQKELLLSAVSRPYGLVLVTGPTGSGKTVSLYTCLNILNKPDVNISTAEDPCEIPLAGINQVNVNDKQGLTFAAALKSFLRQDPDVIMIGEIRDLETADMAIKAASTGHMVLSTLHTNDAPSTLTRLLNMGVAPFNIASAVSLITAQRLARRLCKNCKVPLDVPKEALLGVGFTEEDLDGSWQLYGPKEGGCEMCNNGYKGRVGIYQVMPITDEISRIIMKSGNAHDIADQAKIEGVKDLRQSGLLKVMQGLTSIEEVEACTNE